MVNITSFDRNGNFAAAGAVAFTPALCNQSALSASRGILAMQGIRLSSHSERGSDLGLQVFATKAQAPKHIVKQDKPMGGWHPAVAYAATGTVAVDIEAGITLADVLAARLRPTTHPATVIRSRHRSRLR
ncbi:hypothetical protein [Nocardia huaxiensis]|uniref:Uncharacterized protein n=1 Tax=Nocardia huaxiensis TaxID=2755382 RepID=A0A7D7A0J4_9NOCA|nr:hypothetical protein [Nocardia huaxiensis]QLY33009.1 hypothetical protein H0264_12895 [Nocardia huaxiensis]UFS93230.1 hypothetical protein LPY97_20465 [Nocardia huaxiensis]